MAAALPDPNLIEDMSAWSMNFRQLEAGPMSTQIRVRQGRILSLLEISMDRAVHQKGMAPPDSITFGVPLAPDGMRWRGAQIQAGQFLTFGDENGFEGITDHTFYGVTFSVTNSEIETLAGRLGLPVPDAVRSCGVFDAAETTGNLRLLAEQALGHLDPAKCRAMDLNDEEALLSLFFANRQQRRCV